jgi:ABC-type antimicrobial peptide transport system permease subunit
VAVLTADLGERLFPGGDAVGRRIRLGSAPDAPWRTVVGIVPPLPVANMRNATAPPDAVFVPIAQAPARSMALLVSAGGDSSAALPAALDAMRQLDADLPLSDPTTIAALYHDRSWPIRLFGTIFASFGLAALLLSAAGLYGVMAFRVRSRTQEIGVRMALGAAPSGIVWMVLRQGAALLAGGMVLGLGIGGALGQQMKELRFTVSPWDAGVIGATTLVLAASGLAATLIPARRAAALDPMAALRDQ